MTRDWDEIMARMARWRRMNLGPPCDPVLPKPKPMTDRERYGANLEHLDGILWAMDRDASRFHVRIRYPKKEDRLTKPKVTAPVKGKKTPKK